MLVTKQLLVSIDFHGMEKNTMEVNGDKSCLVTNILQNIFFCVQQKKETLFNESHEKCTPFKYT